MPDVMKKSLSVVESDEVEETNCSGEANFHLWSQHVCHPRHSVFADNITLALGYWVL